MLHLKKTNRKEKQIVNDLWKVNLGFVIKINSTIREIQKTNLFIWFYADIGINSKYSLPAGAGNMFPVS